jgi:hydrogenase maturation factor
MYLIEQAEKMLDLVSVVPEAVEASKMGYVTSMHTPTEGGVLNGLLEMSEASGLGFRIYEDMLPIREETNAICDVLGIDPLKLLSSGSLLISVRVDKAKELVDRLESVAIKSSIIGEIVTTGNILVDINGFEHVVEEINQDELFRILEEK